MILVRARGERSCRPSEGKVTNAAGIQTMNDTPAATAGRDSLFMINSRTNGGRVGILTEPLQLHGLFHELPERERRREE